MKKIKCISVILYVYSNTFRILSENFNFKASSETIWEISQNLKKIKHLIKANNEGGQIVPDNLLRLFFVIFVSISHQTQRILIKFSAYAFQIICIFWSKILKHRAIVHLKKLKTVQSWTTFAWGLILTLKIESLKSCLF